MKTCIIKRHFSLKIERIHGFRINQKMKLDLFYYEKHEGYTQSREESCDFFKDFSMDSLNPLSLLSFLFFEKYLRKVEHIFPK